MLEILQPSWRLVATGCSVYKIDQAMLVCSAADRLTVLQQVTGPQAWIRAAYAASCRCRAQTG